MPVRAGTIQVEYPTLLGQPAPQLKAYPRETVIAEKFQAMVMLGITLATNLATAFLVGIALAFALKSERMTV